MMSVKRTAFVCLYSALTVALFVVLLGTVSTAFAEPSYTMNYQAKLTDSSSVAVADGTYQMVFKLYIAPTGGAAIWTETRSGANEVTVTNGLFSVMLGSVTSLSSVNFNQPLYLGVTIESDSEMTPRKIIGTVPSAFEAKQLGGVASSSFLRSDAADSASGLLTFTGGLISNSSTTIARLSTTYATTTSLYIGGDRITDFTGTGLAMSGNSLTATLGTDIAAAEIADGDHGFFSYTSGVASLDTGGLTSANLSAALTNETGTGVAVFDTAPTFTTSLTVPLIYGGTGAGSGLTLQSTSGSGTSDFIKFLVGNNGATEAARFTTAGRLGIGTTTPNQKLSLFNSANDAAIELSSASGSTYKWSFGIDYSDKGKFKIASSSALGTNDRLTIDGNGWVGVGTTTPRGTLAVAATPSTSASKPILDLYLAQNLGTLNSGSSISPVGEQMVFNPSGSLTRATIVQSSQSSRTSLSGLTFGNLSTFSDGTTFFQYGNNTQVTGSPVINDTSGGSGLGGHLLNIYGTISGVSVTPTITAANSGYAFNTYGGYFSNSSAVSTNNSSLRAYGVYGTASGNFPSLGIKYSGYFQTTGTAGTNYGVSASASGGTINYGVSASGQGTATNYGLYAVATGGTSNYGVYSSVAASSSNYTFYGADTAQSYFAGKVGIGTTSPYAMLSVAGDVVGRTFTATSTTATSTLPRLYASTAFRLGSDYITDITGTGLAMSGNSLTATLGTDISAAEIANGDHGDFTYSGGSATLDNNVITPNKLLTAGQTDEYCLTYESTGTTLEWQTCGAASLFTDAGATTYLNSVTDNFAIGTTTANAKLTVGGNLNLAGDYGYLINGVGYFYASTTNDSLSIGENAGLNFSSGSTDNIAIGRYAGAGVSNTAADNNNFIGYFAGYSYNGTSGARNNIFGTSAGSYTDGDSLFYNNTGSDNNIIGGSAGYGNSGDYNNLIGTAAGYLNSGSYNNLIGFSAGGSGSGKYNDFIGALTGTSNTGNYNIAMGYAAGYNNTGSTSVMIGYQAGRYLKASSTVAIGGEALYGSAGAAYFGANNVAIGQRAGYAATTGAYNNVLIGYRAADNLTTGNNNIIIGYDIDNITATADNRLNIGNLLFGTGLDGTGTTLSSGNIGIGTSTPNQKLSIFNSTADSAIEFSSASGANYKWTAGIDYSDGAKFKISSSSALGTNDRLVIDGSGNVGIGTSNPSWLLDVQGASAIGQFKRINNTLAAAPGFLFTHAKGTPGAEANITAGTMLGKIQFRGRIGSVDTDYAGLTYSADGTSAGDGHFAFTKQDLSTELLTVESDTGNVGIGDDTPDAKLDVNLLSTNSTAGTEYGSYISVSDGGTLTSGTDTSYGSRIDFSRTNVDTGGSAINYGQYLSVQSDAAISTANNTTYGQYIDVTGTGRGTSISTGLYVNASGSDTNYSAIFTGGNFGIGDTTPASLFTVGSGDLFQINSSGVIASSNNITPNSILSSGQTDEYCLTYESTGTTFEWQTCGGGAALFTDGGATTYLTASGDNLGIGTSTANQALTLFRNAADSAIEFSSASGANYKWTAGIDYSDKGKFKIASSSALGTNDRLVIDGSGKVGIGTSSPSQLFSVQGKGYFTDGIIVKQGNSAAPAIVSSADLDDGLSFANNYIGFTFDNNSAFSMTDSEFGGAYDGAPILTAGLTQTAGNPGLRFYNDSNTGLFSSAADTIGFTTGGTERLSITSAGRVGIGTTTPNQKLSIFNSAADSAIEFSSASGANYKWTAGIDYSDGAKFKISSSSALGTNDRFVINGSGNVGIGNSSPTAKLHINSGSSFTSGSAIYVAPGTATTLSGNFIGQQMDFQTSVTAANLSVTGIKIYTPMSTNTGASTYNHEVFSAGVGGATYAQNTAAGTSNWSAFKSYNPNITQTTGTVRAYGADITTGSITTGGTQGGLNVSASGVGAGTLYGANFSNITAGAGTEYAVNIGTGWDAGIYSQTTGLSYFAGSVGIGDATPASLFTVGSGDLFQINSSGVIASSNNITPNSILSSGQTDEYCLTYESTGTTFEWQTCGGGSSLFTDGGATSYLTSTTDKLALGTTTANQALTIFRSAADSAIEFSSASGSTYKYAMGIDYSDGAKFKISSSSALGTNDRFVIDGSGKVGIGTATLTQELTLAGDIEMTNAASRSITIAGASGVNTGGTLTLQAGTGGSSGGGQPGGDLNLKGGTGVGAFSGFYGAVNVTGSLTVNNGSIVDINYANFDLLQGGSVSTVATTSRITASYVGDGEFTFTDGTVYGQEINVTHTSPNPLGTTVTYGQRISVAGDTTPASTIYGQYVSVAGADTNYSGIFTGGNFGIGDTTPDAMLDVETDAASSYVARFFNDGNNANRYGIHIQAGADDGSGTTYYLDAYDGDGTQVGYIANTSGTFALTDVSDIRTKVNVTDTAITSASDVINALRVVDFNRKQDPDGPRITGFIAQEVEQVYPFAVTHSSSGYLGVMKDAFVPLLVKNAQEQQGVLNTQADSIATLGDSLMNTIKSISDLEAAVSSGLSENYHTEDETLEAGELVTLEHTSDATIRRATYSDEIFGVVSKNAGMILGDGMTSAKPVALAGRVEVKVNNEGGAIEQGDAVALSSVPGIGAKATTTRRVIGTALEDAHGDTDTIHIYVDPQVYYAHDELNAVADLFVPIDNREEDTLWNRITTLASHFVDGILSVAGIKTDELCVGDVCVDQATFLKMVNSANATPSAPSGGGGTSSPPADEGPADTPKTAPESTPAPSPEPTPLPEPSSDPAPVIEPAPEPTPVIEPTPQPEPVEESPPESQSAEIPPAGAT